MEPRLKTSKKWTSFPSEYMDKIEEVFREAFSQRMGSGSKLFIDGRFYKKELCLSIGYLPEKKIGQANFMISLDFNSQKENAVKTIYLAIDVAAAMMTQYLESNGEDSEFPRVWEETDFDGRSVYIQYSAVNTTLEAQADHLLGETTEDGLVRGDDYEDEIDLFKKTIGIDET